MLRISVYCIVLACLTLSTSALGDSYASLKRDDVGSNAPAQKRIGEMNKPLNVFILNTMTLPLLNESIASYQQKLISIAPERTFEFEVRNAESDLNSAKKILVEVASRNEKPDIIITVATLATQAIVEATNLHDIPIQFMVVSDPVSLGIVKQIGEVSPFNITGFTHVITAKTKLDMMQQLLQSNMRPDAYKIALLYSDYPSSLNAFNDTISLESAYPEFELVPVKYQFKSGNESLVANRQSISQALKDAGIDFDGYWISTGPAAHDPLIPSSVFEHTGFLPFFSEDYLSVKGGAMFGIMTSPTLIARRAAIITKKIIDGAPCNQLPIERLDAFILAVNLTTAIEKEMIIPSSMLALADKNVFR